VHGRQQAVKLTTIDDTAPPTGSDEASIMAWIITKYLATAALVVLVSELARRTGRLGAFVDALPLVTVLALIWLHLQGQPPSRLADLARYTFWYVFLAFPLLLSRIGFWPGLLACAALTMVCFGITVYVARRLGVELL
jgi:hypothetical protein